MQVTGKSSTVSLFRKRAYTLALLGMLFLTGTSVQAATTYLNLPVTFNTTALAMDSPLIKMDDVVYMPVREWLMAVNGRMTYLRKEDAYELKVSGNTTLIVAPYSPELWVSGRQHFMHHPAVYVDRQLYVPLQEFSWIIGSKAEITTAGVTIRFSGFKQSVSKAASKASVLAAREENPFVLDQLPIPNLRNATNPLLHIGDKSFPLKDFHLYHNDKLYIYFDPIFEALGGKTVHTPNTTEVDIFGKKLIFFKTDQRVVIKEGIQEDTRYMADVFYTKDKLRLLSLQAVSSVLGLQPQWIQAKQTLVLASRIQRIALEQRDNALALVIRTSMPIVPIVPTASQPVSQFRIRFPNTVLGISSGELPSPMGPLTAVGWQQEGTDAFLTVTYEERGTVFPPVAQQNNWVMTFQNTVSLLQQTLHEGKPAIDISASHPFSIRGWTLESGKLVLDIPNTVITLPLTIAAAEKAPYTKIRTSQFSWTPLSARIVVDLTEKMGYTLVKKDAQTWRIVFDKQATAGKKQGVLPTVSVTAAVAIPTQTKISAAPPAPALTGKLQKKVIFIDPGHGGDDPGAIGPNDEYEKEFTLDISLRLGKLLTAQGAQVVYARTGDQNPTLQERVEMAERSKAALFVSVHINSFFHSYANGTETYYFKPEDKPVAEAVHPEILQHTQGKNNGLKRARLYVLRNSTMPAILVEPLFLTNKTELEKLKQPAFRQGLAQAIADGIVGYYQKPTP